ncbi:MAG: hypothetical protein MRY64_07170 [Hyphomonadaceae bacterium]|nr:hypothetical protein [Hyphomonadaceae bacterium]
MQRYRPKSISILALLIAWMAHRLAMVIFMDDLGDPGLPAAWAVVFQFDIAIGVSAPLLAAWLFRGRGLGIWTLAVAWNVFGLASYVAAFILDSVEPWTAAPDVLTWLRYSGSAIHLITLMLLSSMSTRIYCLDRR